jgi:hypothetical protein
MITLRQRQDFTHEEISDLDKKVTIWSSAWISLTGREGMTNYIHMICSGHLVEYLKKMEQSLQILKSRLGVPICFNKVYIPS